MTESASEARRLSSELLTAVLRQLRSEWKGINLTYFKGALVPPTIEISDVAGRLGRWVLHTRTIEISRQLIGDHPWGVVVEVLKHETAHQYVHEGLSHYDETAHGPAFRAVCQKLGIDATAAGVPSAGAAPEGEQRILQRIARLLALAESSNLHEAEAAMNAAQRLMLKYNLEVGQPQGPGARGYGFRHVGQPSGRITESQRLVAVILNKHFFVECIWVHTYSPLLDREGRVLELCGTPANLELAEYVHAFLHQTADRLWREHKRARRIRGDRDRRTYLSGVMLGFEEKLATQSRENQQEGLVWAGDADLSRYYRRRHPHIRHTRHQGHRRTEAHAEGRAAGRNIVLHRPVQASSGGGGNLLPSGK